MTFPKNCDILEKTEKGRSVLRVEELLNSINFGLSIWVSNVQFNNCINFYDINRISEGFVCVLLNTVYGYELNDLNEKQKNQCAIDLGDIKKGFSVQVTSRTDATKIKDTLKKFVENQFENIYPNGVKFFIISNSPVKKGRTKWTDFPFFDFGRDIIYPADIVAEINKIACNDISKLEQIQSIISRYIGVGMDRVPSDMQIIEDLVKCFDRPAFVTPFMMESNLSNFDKAIEDTIQAVNTGIYCLRDGTEIARIKSRFSVSDQKSKEILREIVDNLIELRMMYQKFLNTGDIRRCGCGQPDCGVHMISQTACFEMDRIRKEILNELKRLFPKSKIRFLEM